MGFIYGYWKGLHIDKETMVIYMVLYGLIFG